MGTFLARSTLVLSYHAQPEILRLTPIPSATSVQFDLVCIALSGSCCFGCLVLRTQANELFGKLFELSHNLLFSIRIMDNIGDIFWQRKPLF